MNYFLLFLFILCPAFSLAAPMPATSSSFFISKHPGLFYSPEGFSVHSEKTNWVQQESPIENQNILALYRSPNKEYQQQASLTIRIDKLKRKLKMNSYIKTWKKDYLKFGMSIVNSKKVRIKDNKAFMIDLLGPKKEKFLRQVVFLKERKAVILTCRLHKTSLKRNLSSCNQMFKNFSWL